MNSKPYARACGKNSEEWKQSQEDKPVAAAKDEYPADLHERLNPTNDGVTVGQNFPRKATPITKFEESFILGPRHA